MSNDARWDLVILDTKTGELRHAQTLEPIRRAARPRWLPGMLAAAVAVLVARLQLGRGAS